MDRRSCSSFDLDCLLMTAVPATHLRNSDQSLSYQHTPETALEEEVAALLEAAGAATAHAVQEAEEKLAMKVRARGERKQPSEG